MSMNMRTDRRKEEDELKKQERKDKAKSAIQSRIEEFKLNREGKTKKKRSDVQARYRRTDRILSLFILIVLLLLIITWVIILFI